MIDINSLPEWVKWLVIVGLCISMAQRIANILSVFNKTKSEDKEEQSNEQK